MSMTNVMVYLNVITNMSCLNAITNTLYLNVITDKLYLNVKVTTPTSKEVMSGWGKPIGWLGLTESTAVGASRNDLENMQPMQPWLRQLGSGKRPTGASQGTPHRRRGLHRVWRAMKTISTG